MRLVILLSLITLAFAGSSSKSSKSSKSKKSKSKSKSKSTPSPTTPSPITTTSAVDLCTCWDIDLMADPIISEDEACYWYKATLASDKQYCLDVIDYIILGAGDECALI